MSDIAFSMSADERDVIRGLQAVGKETGSLREQIAGLAELYSDFHAALDPFAPETLAAETAFYERLQTLYAAHAADLPFPEVRRYAVWQCKLYLRRN